MSGHSKWSTIKRKKGAADAKRGQLFTKLAKEVTLAAKSGGDPEANPALRAAIDKAKAANMPKDNIEKARKKGTGELPGVVYEEYIYEGYAPNGVALMILTITDNKNRTTAEIRHILTKYGGNLGEDGCVSWSFDKKGQIFVKKELADEDTIMEIITEAGAEDMTTEEDGYFIICDYKDLFTVADAIKNKEIEVESAEVVHNAQNLVKLNEHDTKKVLKVLSLLDDMDDVSNVFSNLDIPDDMDLEEE